SRAVVLISLEAGRPSAASRRFLRSCGAGRLQLYGDVTPQAVAALRRGGFETVVPFPVSGEESLTHIDSFVSACAAVPPDYLLFDAAHPERVGGTGTRADWNAIEQWHGMGRINSWPPFIIAGGLTPGNIGDVVRTFSPAGVDVSSGVESAPGRKDQALVHAFIAAARAATQNR
ncbi:MAG: hypothetical protein ACE5HE_13995, partial [Phycisphaerae bacterium]